MIVTAPPGEGPVDVFLPIAQTDEHQTVHDVQVRSTTEGTYGTEPSFGNRFWHARRETASGEPWRIVATFDVTRRVHRARGLPGRASKLRPDEARRYAAFLAPSSRVPVGAPVLNPILEEVRASVRSGRAPSAVRAIYDWVVDNVEYKKVGTGWGHGDTHWACNEKYGNCTDFHSLFISLARTEGIPARFEMGFPVPEDRTAGDITGYHCWLQFYLPDVGWVPVDASEAAQHPEKRELFYGTHPPDRVRFTTGRDLRLGERHLGEPLNYFIYPHVQLAGKPWSTGVRTDFHFREWQDATGAAP